MLTIRRFEQQDWLALWPVLRSTFASGDTYAFSPDSTEEEIHKAWIEQPLATFVAVSDSGVLLGTYILKPNQPGLGGHVCNCGYVVAEHARGRGIAASMCEHSQVEAVNCGFRSMQFNLVVATNAIAIRLWQRLGFKIVGTVPEAFLHRSGSYVAAHIMFKALMPRKQSAV
jgi:ribosomal protein S18 acetylase RimI-like enzyme